MLSKILESKIEEAIKLPFVGNYDGFTEEEINDLYREVGGIFRRVVIRWGEIVNTWEYKTIFVALVCITKEWQSGETGWLSYLSRKIFGSDNQIQGKAYGIITKCIEGLAKSNDIFMLTSTRDKYYATICCHAFSPLSSIESLFDLCWEIYAKDFDLSYTAGSSLLTSLAHSLKIRFEKSLNDQNFNLGSKVYSLRIGLKGLAVDNPEALCKLLNEILLDIDYCFNNKSFPNSDYLTKLVSRWWKKKSSTFGQVKKRQFNSAPAKDCSSFHPKFISKDGIPCLLIPRIRLSDSFQSDLAIKVRNGEEIKIDQPLETYGSGLLTATNEICFPLDKISSNANLNISVHLYKEGQKVYDSKESLFRSFILFDQSGKEARGISLLPGNYFLYIDDVHKGRIPQDIRRIKGNYFSLIAQESDVLQVGTEIVYFEHIQTNKRIYLAYDKAPNVKFDADDIEYDIIKGDLFLVVGKEVNLKDIGLECGRNRYSLSDFHSKELEDKIQFELNSIVSYGLPVSLLLFSYSTGQPLFALNCLRFSSFSMSFDRDLYYSNSSKDADAKIGEVTFSFDNQLLKDIFDISQDELSIPYKNGKFFYIPPVLKWSIDNGEYSTEPKTVYFEQFTNASVLKLSVPLDADDVLATTVGPLMQDKQGNFKLGSALYSENCRREKEVAIFLKRKGEFYEILRVFMHPGFLFNPILVEGEEKSLIVDLSSLIGPSNLKLELVVSSKEVEDIAHYPLSEKVNLISLHHLNDGPYLLSVAQKKSVAFKQVVDVIFSKNVFIGDKRKFRFKGKAIRLKKIMPIGKEDFRPMSITYRVGNISYLKTIDGCDIYQGELYKRDLTDGHWKKIIAIRDKSRNPIKVNPLRIELMTDHTCYLGYGLDLEDQDLQSYDEFSISCNGYNLLVGIGWSPSISIDYYYFDTEEIKHV